MNFVAPFGVALVLAASANANAPYTLPIPDPTLPMKVTLDCSLGFDALVAHIRAQPNPRIFEDADEIAIQIIPEHSTYTITRPGHYAHPAIVLTQYDVGEHGTIVHEHCGYGSREGLARLIEDFKRRDMLQFTDGPASQVQR